MPTVKRKGLPTGLKCELDGGEMVIKWGRNGEFLACSNYPKCTNTKEFIRDDQGNIVPQERQALSTEPTDEVCEKCGKPMVRRRSRFGEFLGCSGYPDCDGIKRLQVRPGQDRRQLPRMQRGRNAGTAQPPRQAVLRMRPLSEVQVRELGQSRGAAMPAVRLGLPGREGDQARGRALAMPQ